MGEPLKNNYNRRFMETLGREVKNHYSDFSIEAFADKVIDENWEGRELKERMRHIAISLHGCLPFDYKKQIEILLKVSENLKGGFYGIIFPDFVEVFGLEDWETSILALEAFTIGSSSEFAVRPFIVKDQERMMKQMVQWSVHPNEHVRRLASEGCRPRLPWAMALNELKKDPAPVLPILENLKNDPSEYVRRSVANNLNDISKDHPELALDIAYRWLGESKNVDWVVKHACRGLLKQHNTKALLLFGYSDPKNVAVTNLVVSESEIAIGDDLNFSFEIETSEEGLGKIRIEYAIEYMKARGKHSRKVFKISEGEVAEKRKIVARKQSFKDMSTRKHYPGEHFLSIIINGEEKGRVGFMVTLS